MLSVFIQPLVFLQTHLPGELLKELYIITLYWSASAHSVLTDSVLFAHFNLSLFPLNAPHSRAWVLYSNPMTCTTRNFRCLFFNVVKILADPSKLSIDYYKVPDSQITKVNWLWSLKELTVQSVNRMFDWFN